MDLAGRVKGGSDEDAPPEPEQDGFTSFYCEDAVASGHRLYPGDEDPELRNTMCCSKPECRAEWRRTEFEEADDIDFTGLDFVMAKGFYPVKYTSQFNGVSWYGAGAN